MTRLSQLLFQFTVDVEFEREKIIFIAPMLFFKFPGSYFLQLFYPSSKG